ncbi:energy transducer TonB [Hymenobacter persicinus]|uniref:Energy transducer TonB n=1 Tax=Hymenobacter persicinus TaxID=2025506 RepID=A0A4Q5LB36_9BACT|nr:energy transducer TonB [Hymenobacter persicinus]RYU79016.1 energy transducer TonB [Hymenobacter persicinus]
MKKITFVLALGLLAGSAPAFAQKTKVKVKSDGPTPELTTPAPAEAPAPAATPAPGHVGKSIPVAEYYEGGQDAMYEFIEKELKYPIMARRNRIQGTCIVSFTLNTDGTMSGIKLVKNVGGGCGEEALRLTRLLKFNKPSYAVLTSLPIVFKLPTPTKEATPTE